MAVLRRLNLKITKEDKLTIEPTAIPTLIDKQLLAVWQENDSEPYYKIQKIEYPVKANGVNYLESFFKSYTNKIKQRPIPGSKFGHEMSYGKRAPTDLLLVGAKMEKNGDGSGVVYLKNYIPPVGESGDNSIFIRQNKSDMIHYSIVSYVKEERKEENGEYIIDIVESMYGERNDACEWGTGAMKQVTNVAGQRIISKSVANAKKLINAGDVDESSSWSFTADDGNKLLGADGDDWANYAKWHFVENTEAEEETKGRYKYPYGKNGKVYRSALRAIAGRAGQQGWDELSDLASSLIDLIDKKQESSVAGDINSEEGEIMNKEELLKKLTNLKTNAEVTLFEVAEAMNLGDQVVTDEHVNAIKIMNTLKDMKVDDPVKEINTLRERIKTNEETVKNARLDTEFGADNGKNYLRQYASQRTKELGGDEFEKEINNLKTNDSVAKRLSQDRADYTSEENQLGRSENNQQTAVTGRRVDKV